MTKMDYNEFLSTKLDYGYSDAIPIKIVHEKLFDFQKAIVKWALKRGSCVALFAVNMQRDFIGSRLDLLHSLLCL